MLNTLKGVEMEILDGAYPLLHSIEIGCDPLILFKDVEVVGKSYLLILKCFLVGILVNQGWREKTYWL